MLNADIFNGIGVFFILLPFLLSTFGWMSPKSRMYFLMNFVGSALAFYGSILMHSVPFIILEATWAIVAAIGLIRRQKPAA